MIFTFFTYFGTMEKVAVTQTLYISISIRFKRGLRRILEQNKEAKCLPDKSTIENQIRYKCSYETSGEEIDNVQINDKFNFSDGENNIEIASESPLAKKNKDSLQNIGNTDIFDGKELYILNDAHVESENNIFNITGQINKKDFNYDTLDLMITLHDQPKEATKNIPCLVNKINQDSLTLNCESELNLQGSVIGSFSNLRDANLLVDLKKGENGDITLIKEEEEPPIQSIHKRDKEKLSAGAIVLVVITVVIILTIIAFILICGCRKQKSDEPTNQNMISNSSTIINN
jgi:hypothetical protein